MNLHYSSQQFHAQYSILFLKKTFRMVSLYYKQNFNRGKKNNAIMFFFLSSQAELTRTHLKNVVQENLGLPDGPLFLSPSSLIKAFHR